MTVRCSDATLEARFLANPVMRGQDSPHAKLTELDIKAIRASAQTSVVLSKLYGVGEGQISRIKNRKRWVHV